MTEKELRDAFGTTANEWQKLTDMNRYEQAKSLSRAFIQVCKRLIVNSDDSVDNDVRSKALILGILFRGLEDYNDLSELTSIEDWESETKQIEKIWSKMWDCLERIEYASSHLTNAEVLTSILRSVFELKSWFVEEYGHGFYSSPEILIKREVCSICKCNFKVCGHFAGAIYGGIRCVSEPKDFELRSISIVEFPEDPRCRIWPWQFQKGNALETAVLTTFRLDDFIEDNSGKDSMVSLGD